MIGVRVGFQQPFDGQVLRLDRSKQGIRGFGRRARRLGIEIEDRIDFQLG